MSNVIIYRNDTGGISILRPTPEELSLRDLDSIAKKDVPAGCAYAIASEDVVPSDRLFRNAWDISDDALVDGFGADYGNGSEWAVVGHLSDSMVVVRNERTGETMEISR